MADDFEVMQRNTQTAPDWHPQQRDVFHGTGCNDRDTSGERGGVEADRKGGFAGDHGVGGSRIDEHAQNHGSLGLADGVDDEQGGMGAGGHQPLERDGVAFGWRIFRIRHQRQANPRLEQTIVDVLAVFAVGQQATVGRGRGRLIQLLDVDQEPLLPVAPTDHVDGLTAARLHRYVQSTVRPQPCQGNLRC